MWADRNESARRAARLDAVFGHVLPDVTEDERARQQVEDRADEDLYLRERPPHHERT
jgi:hypothetical protein